MDLDVTTIFQLYIGLTGLLYYVCTTVVTVVGTTFLIETTAHLTALAHSCFTGSALVITLFIIVGATVFFFFIETAGLLTTTTHSCFNGSVRLHSLLFTGFRNHVFNWDRLPYLRRGLIYVLMGRPAHFGGVQLYTSSPCDSWVELIRTSTIYCTKTILALLVLIIGACTPW